MANDEMLKQVDTDFKEYAKEKLHYVELLVEMGLTFDQALIAMIYFCLDETNAVLGTTEFGDIAENLSSLSDCVGYVPPMYSQGNGYSFLRIGGSVDSE